MAARNYILTRQSLLIALLTLLVFALSATGCTAETEVKQGADGEFCNGLDDDCRGSAICIDFVCQEVENGDHCENICDAFEECGVSQANCIVACHNTTRQWGEEPLEDFTRCLTEDLTCDEIRNIDDPPQECYNRLPLSDERRDLCREFVSEAQDCGASTSEFSTQCRYMARTRSEEIWTGPDYAQACVERIAEGVCEDIVGCLNDVFEMEPPMTAAP